MTENVQTLAETVKPVKRKTPEMAALVGSGYGMTLQEAKAIITERDKDPMTHSFDDYKKAKAFIAAYETDPIPTSTRKGWKRSPGKR